MAEAAAPWKRARLPAAVADELRLCCLLGAEVAAPLDAPLCPGVAATDASLHRLGEVAWLWSRTSAKGSRSHTIWPGYVNLGGDLIPVDELLHNWVSGA